MSQRLGGSLRRKVSETETQLLALQEAKLAAISGTPPPPRPPRHVIRLFPDLGSEPGAGNDFSGAKQLKAEMKVVQQERGRLQALAGRLQGLSSGSSRDLEQMKEQRQQLREELQREEAQHGQSPRQPPKAHHNPSTTAPHT